MVVVGGSLFTWPVLVVCVSLGIVVSLLLFLRIEERRRDHQSPTGDIRDRTIRGEDE